MRRDWDLARPILLKIEALEASDATLGPDALPGYDPEQVSYHFRLLDEAGLIHPDCSRSLNAPLHCWARSLTWAGHELLDQIWRDTVWNRARGFIRERGLDVSLHTLKIAAGKVVEGLLEYRSHKPPKPQSPAPPQRRPATVGSSPQR